MDKKLVFLRGEGWDPLPLSTTLTIHAKPHPMIKKAWHSKPIRKAPTSRFTKLPLQERLSDGKPDRLGEGYFRHSAAGFGEPAAR